MISEPFSRVLGPQNIKRNAAAHLRLVLHRYEEAIMKVLLASSLLTVGLLATDPASGQRLEIGPDGPSVDMRSRGQRERDIERREMRRDMRRDEVPRDRRDRSVDPDDDDED